MADQIIVPAPSGLLNLITAGLKRVSDGRWYRPGTGAFEAPSGTDRTNYTIAVAEDGQTGFYQADMPPVAAGRYLVAGFRQLGATPAWSDERSLGEAAWTGSAWVTQSSMAAAVAAAVGAPVAGPTECEVFGKERGNGVWQRNVLVIKQIVTPNYADGSILYTAREEAYSGPDGRWSFIVPRGVQVRIRINDSGADKTFTVPDQESYDFYDELVGA